MLAVVDRDRRLTYREINGRANQVARRLLRLGVAPGSIVGLDVRASAEMLIGMLAVLKAGGAYLPIDCAYPAARVEYILAHSGVGVVLRQGTGLLDGATALLCLDLLDEASYTGADDNPGCTGAPSDLAYVMYTSGSTGLPKGVCIEHRSVTTFIEDLAAVIDLSAGQSILALTTASFDISVIETLLPLTRGMTVIVADDEERADVGLLRRRIVRSGVDVLQLTPSRLRLVLDDDDDLTSLRHLSTLLVGGEALPDDLFARLRGAPFKTYNLYGPTETTVYSAVKQLRDGEKVTIGRPLARTRMYVASADGQAQGPGGEGELLIAGAGLARGYLHAGDLTAERFVRSRFAPWERVYRTGDRARWTPGDDFEYLGRIDRPIKLRGYKVELGEIETLLRAHPRVSNAVVEIVAGPGGGEDLCAYVVAARACEPLDAGGLRDDLAQKLPAYMVPAFFVELDRLPLTPNGKIDVRALPAPSVRAGDGLAPPRNDLETRLYALWVDVLGLPPEAVGTDRVFFDIGGNSLRAGRLLGRVHAELGVDVPIRVLFDDPTIEGLARHIASATRRPLSPIAPRLVSGDCDLSSQQSRVFLLQRFAPWSTAYNLPEIYRVEGDLDGDRLERAFQDLIARHASLRTSFHDRHGLPVQTIHDSVPFRISFTEATAREAAEAVQAFVRPFDLSQPPLLRVAVTRTGPSRALLMIDFHHIAADGFSRDIIVDELRRLYTGESLPAVRIQYPDYALWQRAAERAETLADQRAFWTEMFASPAPRPSLPSAHSRPDVRRLLGRRLACGIDAPALARVKELAREERASLFMVLLALSSAYVGRLTRQDDVVIGSPISGRAHPDTEATIGMFVNTVAVRTHPSPARSFREHLREVRATVLGAFDNQDYQFDRLVADLGLTREPARNPLFDVMFLLQETETAPLNLPGVTLIPHEAEHTTSKLDLTIGMREVDGRLDGYLEYDLDLFVPAAAEHMRDGFVVFVRWVLKQVDVPLGRVDFGHETRPEAGHFAGVDFDFS